MSTNDKNHNLPKLKIKFMVGAFDKGFERAGFKESRNYTKKVAEMNGIASVLDRYDEFESLTLVQDNDSSVYKKNGEYGIDKIRQIHDGDDRLLPHQIEATKAFLRDLRGFGLLADVVGSGKTYEACSVLSELSAKGKINTMLLIVPSQVFDTWVQVLELNFGLGKNILKQMGCKFDCDNLEIGAEGLYRPTVPIIVKTEDFVRWEEYQISKVLFDVVVVDEAHNLCIEEGEYAKALKLLSCMMETKKKAKKTYCILLSATPHSGNLEQMFRLWYFIRCKGGCPADFDEKSDAERSENYRKEKNYYMSYICRGSSTVMEFIQNVKYSEVTQNFGRDFDNYLKKENVVFSTLLKGEQKNIIEAFLNEEENENIKEKIIKNIANAYHNGILRSIMIRQPNDRIRKGKFIENYFFFPAEYPDKELKVKDINGGGNFTYLPYEEDDNKKVISRNGDYYSLKEYLGKKEKDGRANTLYKYNYANICFNADVKTSSGVKHGLLGAYGLNDSKFTKAKSLGYYQNSLIQTQVSSEENIHFEPIYDGNIYNAKLEKLKSLLRIHKDKRVLVFFDYDIKSEEKCFDKVIDNLSLDIQLKKRIIIGEYIDKQKTIDKFQMTEDAILIVTNNSFTEGANLQKCNIIVNFQVTPNPLAMEQRIGRIFRLGQENDVTIYSFADMTSLEGYVLMYYNVIGLMSSNSGDAAIIAGSNNDNMVTIRCTACGKSKLLSKDDYEEYKKKDCDEIYCNASDVCKQDSSRGMLMQEINSSEEKCDKCGRVIRRQNSKEGGQFYCLSTSGYGSGVMCNSGEFGDRALYCRKICAIAHCQRFLNGQMKDKCDALKYYYAHPNASDCDLEELCDNCLNKNLCYEKCKINTNEEAIKSCKTCSEASCMPKPHVVKFNANWEAECPNCKQNGKHGVLRPVIARTFETYIRSAYDYQQDGGQAFCDNLSKECSKVSIIREILSKDKVDI